MDRRQFIKYAGGGLAVIVVGSKLPWMLRNSSSAAAVGTSVVQAIELTITDAMKEMATHNSLNDARCYFWIYKSNVPNYAPECPGPIIMAAKGDVINIAVTNSLDEDHAFFIPGLVDSGPIAPGVTWNGVIDLTTAPLGSHLYYDNLNAPVNRVMGLHGAFIVMPTEADRTPGGHNLTPYGGLAANHGVQRLYDEFGRNTQTNAPSAHFPGLAWEEGDPSTWALYDPAMDGPTPLVNCPPFRTYVWLTHQASPNLFAEVGNLPAGQIYDAQTFLNKFLRDTFHLHQHSSLDSMIPQYFTINGQSGMLSHFNPAVTPIGRVGEPVVVHILNAGLWTHSMHLHANHFWVTSINGAPNPNPIWVDVFRVDPMDRIDYTIPFMRPPDVGHPSGIGMPETPLQTVANPRISGSTPHPVWPPIEEFDMYMPPLGTKAKNALNQDVELGQRMSPLCYPMHDHSEPSQTSQGGNYNTGLISGIYFSGDRNGVMDFPMDEDFHMAYHNYRGIAHTERAAPPLGEVHPQ